VYRPFNKKIFYKNSPLHVYRQEPSLENSLDQSNYEVVQLYFNFTAKSVASGFVDVLKMLVELSCSPAHSCTGSYS